MEILQSIINEYFTVIRSRKMGCVW